MKKSSSIFIIMGVIYLIISILDGFALVKVPDNILFGLSLSALLSAISDILYNIGWKRIATNEFDYIVKVSLKFLSEKQSKNVPISNPNINIRGVIRCVKNMSKNYKNAVHPVEYYDKKSILVLRIGSQIAFILSIVVFIALPFLPFTFQSPISTSLTLGAFSAMCFNLYITEAISDISNKRNDDFMNKEQLIIQTAYPDFFYFLNERLQSEEEIIPSGEVLEVKTDAHS